jgi:uncharacterized protein (DUF433 family)
MTDENLLSRITLDPEVKVGKPVIRGTRLTVEYVVGLLAAGATIDEVLEEYDGLAGDDVRACLLFASRSLESMAFMPLGAKTS